MGQQRYIIQGLDANVSFLQEIKALLLNENFTDIWFLTAYCRYRKDVSNISCKRSSRSRK